MLKLKLKQAEEKALVLPFLLVAYDLKIIFDGGIELKVFFLETDIEDKFDHYTFFTPDVIFAVEHRSILAIEDVE